MRCSICGQKLLKYCPDCKKELKDNNVICGNPMVPKNHCYNCWSKK